ncbi:MAG: tetratricopeptide repeat protein [Treponema sp.]|nr:tetratricopeptide repeat protein [Treponema sp.]
MFGKSDKADKEKSVFRKAIIIEIIAVILLLILLLMRCSSKNKSKLSASTKGEDYLPYSEAEQKSGTSGEADLEKSFLEDRQLEYADGQSDLKSEIEEREVSEDMSTESESLKDEAADNLLEENEPAESFLAETVSENGDGADKETLNIESSESKVPEPDKTKETKVSEVNNPEPDKVKEASDEKKADTELRNMLDAFANSESDSEKEELLENAIKNARKILEKDPTNDAAYYFVAQDELKKRNYELAMEALARAIEFNKFNYLYYYDSGKVCYLRKDFNQAIADFKRSIELNDNFHPSWYNLGLCELKFKRVDSALDAFLHAVNINPEYEKGWLETARAYNRLKDSENAIEAYKKVIEINSKNILPVMELGSIYFEECRFEDAEEMYKNALMNLADGEEQTLTKYNLSIVLIEDKKYEEALPYAWSAYDEKDSLRNDTIRSNVTYNYALVQELLGNNTVSLDLYRESIALNPNQEKSKINLANILMMTPGSEAEAVEVLESLYEKNPENQDILENLANACMLASFYEKSRDYYIQLLDIDNEDWIAYLNISKCYIQLGDSENALRYLAYLNANKPDFKSEEVEMLLNSLL